MNNRNDFDTMEIIDQVDDLVNRGNDIEAKLRRCLLDQSKDYPPPVSLVDIIQDGSRIPILTRKSISLWQGKQKSKKTTALAMVTAAYIGGDDCRYSDIISGNGGGTVHYFDCEQGESYGAKTMKLIQKLANSQGLELPNDRLKYYDLREFVPNERMEMIKWAISHDNTIRLVIIDGMVDLMNDFMAADEAHRRVTEILKMCSEFDIHIATVLHQNKKDDSARAHIGSITSQKCEMEISVEVDQKDKARSIVKVVNSRGMPFQDFAVRWDKGCLPAIDEDYSGKTQENAGRKTAKYNYEVGIGKKVLAPPKALRHKDLIPAIQKEDQCSPSTAKRILDNLVAWGIIEVGSDKHYRLIIK